jgi:hypothetical protein
MLCFRTCRVGWVGDWDSEITTVASLSHVHAGQNVDKGPSTGGSTSIECAHLVNNNVKFRSVSDMNK